MENKNLKFIPVVLISVLILLGAFAVVNAQGQDSDGKLASIDMDTVSPVSNDTAPVFFEVQAYASHYGVSVDEALRRFQLQSIPVPNEELRTNEAETFAGMWIEHTPEFKIVVQFTRNGEETIKPYLKNYPEFADIVEVRNTAKVSLANLERIRDSASSSLSALGIPMDSSTNVPNNTVEFYVAKSNKIQFDNVLQRKGIRLPDTVKVISVESLATPTANIYGGLLLNGPDNYFSTSGFSVKNSAGTKGITTAGHSPNTGMSYNGNNLPFQSQKWEGSYDIQWHTAPGYTVTNKIQIWADGGTRDITSKKSRNNQMIGEIVCKYGSTTCHGCGKISRKDYNPGGVGATYIRVDSTEGWGDLSEPGDSGGPWFVGNTAYGTMVGQIGNDAYYMAVNYLEYGLGVTILTS